jgi:hypothetical protein
LSQRRQTIILLQEQMGMTIPTEVHGDRRGKARIPSLITKAPPKFLGELRGGAN